MEPQNHVEQGLGVDFKHFCQQVCNGRPMSWLRMQHTISYSGDPRCQSLLGDWLWYVSIQYIKLGDKCFLPQLAPLTVQRSPSYILTRFKITSHNKKYHRITTQNHQFQYYRTHLYVICYSSKQPGIQKSEFYVFKQQLHILQNNTLISKQRTSC